MSEQYVGIDLHRRRSVIVRMTGAGEVLETIRDHNDTFPVKRPRAPSILAVGGSVALHHVTRTH
jgi:hypothetical protein